MAVDVQGQWPGLVALPLEILAFSQNSSFGSYEVSISATTSPYEPIVEYSDYPSFSTFLGNIASGSRGSLSNSLTVGDKDYISFYIGGSDYRLTLEDLYSPSNATDLSYKIYSGAPFVHPGSTLLESGSLSSSLAIAAGDGALSIGESSASSLAAGVYVLEVSGSATSGAAYKFSIKPPNSAPTLTSIASSIAAQEDVFKEISYADLAAAANEADVDGDSISFRIEAVSSGTLQIWSGAAWSNVVPGTTLLSSTGKLQWKGNTNANGLSNAFTVRAWDGALASSTPVQVAINTTAVNDAPTGSVTVSGTAMQNQVLSVSNTLADADGLGTISYRWERAVNGSNSWSPITGATATSYTLVQADVGQQVRAVASYSDGGSTVETVASAPTAAVLNVNDAPTGYASITGVRLQGQKLTVQYAIDDVDGIGDIRFQWQRSQSAGNSAWLNIGGANAGSYETDEADVGKSLRVLFSYVDYFGARETFLGSVSGIIANINDQPVGRTWLSGVPEEGRPIYFNSSIDDPDGIGTFAIDWQRLQLGSTTWKSLQSSSSNEYLIQRGDSGGLIRAVLTYVDGHGSREILLTENSLSITSGNTAPTVSSVPLPSLSVNRGTAFSYVIPSDYFRDSDSLLTLSASSLPGTALPSWLLFNPSTGILSGTPTSGGAYRIFVSAADELGSVSAPLDIEVRELQSLSSSPSKLLYKRGTDITLPIYYTTTDGSNTTGLSFKVHFNSSLFSFDPTKGITNKAQADLFQVGAVEHDTANSDNDSSTDKFIPIVISSFSGNFPSAALPIKLADLTFTAADKPIDPLTGLKDTSINFSETEAATGYGFLSSAASLKPLSFSLDVDGDGKVTALGDGLMVIRHLFGAAFAGSALTDKAISPDSPLLGGVAYSSMTAQQKAGVAAQVAANIQQGIDAGLLDIDKDGKTTALGDGLMIIRRLFGATFAGTALTDKAISTASPLLNGTSYSVMSMQEKEKVAMMVANNVDSLNPVLLSIF